MLGPTEWTYYYLYTVLDVFSRYVVSWMLAQRELAKLTEKTCCGMTRCSRTRYTAAGRRVSAYRANAVSAKCSGEIAELGGS